MKSDENQCKSIKNQRKSMNIYENQCKAMRSNEKHRHKHTNRLKLVVQSNPRKIELQIESTES